MEATSAHGRGLPWGKTSAGVSARRDAEARERAKSHEALHWPLSQWCARSAVVPPRPIPNRVVKRGSAEGTGGMPAGRVGPCTQSSRRGAVAARRAHNPKVDGSNPSAATNYKTSRTIVSSTSVLEVLSVSLRTMQSWL